MAAFDESVVGRSLLDASLLRVRCGRPASGAVTKGRGVSTDMSTPVAVAGKPKYTLTTY
jgi:hypothetical protein